MGAGRQTLESGEGCREDHDEGNHDGGDGVDDDDCVGCMICADGVLTRRSPRASRGPSIFEKSLNCGCFDCCIFVQKQAWVMCAPYLLLAKNLMYRLCNPFSLTKNAGVGNDLYFMFKDKRGLCVFLLFCLRKTSCTDYVILFSSRKH